MPNNFERRAFQFIQNFPRFFSDITLGDNKIKIFIFRMSFILSHRVSYTIRCLSLCDTCIKCVTAARSYLYLHLKHHLFVSKIIKFLSWRSFAWKVKCLISFLIFRDCIAVEMRFSSLAYPAAFVFQRWHYATVKHDASSVFYSFVLDFYFRLTRFFAT